MSAIIDELKKLHKKSQKPQSEKDLTQAAPSSIQLIQDKLAETYIKPTKSDKGEIAQFITYYKKNETQKRRINLAFLAILAIMLGLLYFSGNKLQIQFTVSNSAQEASIKKDQSVSDSIRYLDIRNMISEGSMIAVGDLEARQATFQFVNDAMSAKSSLLFTNPIDLSDKQIKFSLKGLNGGEGAKLFFRDVNGDILDSRLTNLNTTWRRFSISLKAASNFFNNKKINQIGFDIGADDLSNSKGTIIFIKDLRIVPAD